MKIVLEFESLEAMRKFCHQIVLESAVGDHHQDSMRQRQAYELAMSNPTFTWSEINARLTYPYRNAGTQSAASTYARAHGLPLPNKKNRATSGGEE
jgi:hypothetical protein